MATDDPFSDIPISGGATVTNDPFGDIPITSKAPDDFGPFNDIPSTGAPQDAESQTQYPLTQQRGLLLPSEELKYPEFSGQGMTQQLTPPSGFLASAGAQLSKVALQQASGVANEYEHLGAAFAPKAFNQQDQPKYDELLGQLNDLRDERARTQEGGGTVDPREVEIANQLKMLGRAPSNERTSGQLMESAQRVFRFTGADPESKNFAAQAGRGVGNVLDLAPTMVLGSVGLPAMALQSASGAYAEAYDKALQDGQGDTEAQQAAADAALKTAPSLALYMVGGKLAGEAGAALMNEASPSAKALIGAAFATGTNVTVGTTLKALEGQDWQPTLESLTTDALFGIIHGYGEWGKANDAVKQKAAWEVARREESAPESKATGGIPAGAERALKTATSGREPSEPSKMIEPQVIDGLILARNALADAGGHESDLSEVNRQLDAFDPAAVQASEARIAQRGQSPPAEEEPSPTSEPGGPPAQLNEFQKLKQAEQEQQVLANAKALSETGSPLTAAALLETYEQSKPSSPTVGDALRPEPAASGLPPAGDGGQGDLRAGRSADGQGDPASEGDAGRIHDDSSEGRVAESDAMSVGPGAASHAEQLGGENIDITNESVDARRTREGNLKLLNEERQSNPDTWAKAEKILETDPTYGSRLVDRLRAGEQQSVTHVEEAALIHEAITTKNARDQEAIRAGDSSSSEAERIAARERYEKLDDRLNEIDQATKIAGTSAARALQIRRMQIRDDYTYDGLVRKARKSQGRDLTKEENQSLHEEAYQIEQRQKERDADAETKQKRIDDEEVHHFYEATINELGKAYLERPSYGKQVLDQARSIVERWKSETEGAADRIRKALGGESGGLGGAGGGPGGKKLGEANAQASLIADIAKVIRAKVGEFGMSRAEALTDLVEQFGDKIRTHFDRAWSKAQQLMADEKGSPKAKEVAQSGQRRKGDPTPVEAKAAAKAEATAGDPLSHKVVYDYVKSLIQSGVHGVDPLMKAAHEGLKESFPDLTERDVRRAFSEYGKVKFPSKEAVAQELADTRRITQLQESIDRLNEGMDALHTGLQREKATQQVREKTKELNELLKKRAGPPSPEKLASRDQAKQTALRNQIADIDKQLRTGEKPKNGAPVADSPATEQLKAERDAMKAKIQEIEDAANPGKTAAEKQIDQLSKIKERLNDKLSGKIPADAPKDWTPLSGEAENLKAEIAAMQELSAQMRRDAKPKTDPEAAREKQQISAFQKAIERYEERLKSGNFTPDGKWNGPLSEKAAAVKGVLDARRAAYKAAREAGKPIRTPEQRYNEMRLKQVEKRTAELEAKMKAGDFSRPPKRTPKVKYPDTLKSEAKLQQVKDAFDTRQRQIEYNNRPAFERKFDLLSGTIRGGKLTRIKTLAKLLAFSVQNLAVRMPLREAFGGVVSKLPGFRELGQRSDIEGGFSGTGLKRLYTGTFGEGLRDARAAISPAFAILSKGKLGDITSRNPLKTLYGEKAKLEPRFYDIPQMVHEMEKSPLLRGAFNLYSEKLFKAAGRDINTAEPTDPLFNRAFAAAEREILMNPNSVANMVKSGIRELERPDKETKRVTFHGKAGAAAIRSLTPFVRVATNHFVQTFNSTLGGFTGLARLIKAKGLVPSPKTLISKDARLEYSNALAKGLSELHPDDANSIMRQIKDGSPGMGIVLFGILAPQFFGGLDPGRKRKDGDPKFGEIRIGNVTIPRYVTFAVPWLLAGQIGATITQAATSFRKKGDAQPRGIGEGVLAASAALAGTGPLVNEGARLEKLSDPNKRGEYLGDWLTSNFIPGFLTEAAEAGDKDAHGETIRRKPEGLSDQLKLNVPNIPGTKWPGVRQTVKPKKPAFVR